MLMGFDVKNGYANAVQCFHYSCIACLFIDFSILEYYICIYTYILPNNPTLDIHLHNPAVLRIHDTFNNRLTLQMH